MKRQPKSLNNHESYRYGVDVGEIHGSRLRIETVVKIQAHEDIDPDIHPMRYVEAPQNVVAKEYLRGYADGMVSRCGEIVDVINEEISEGRFHP